MKPAVKRSILCLALAGCVSRAWSQQVPVATANGAVPTGTYSMTATDVSAVQALGADPSKITSVKLSNSGAVESFSTSTGETLQIPAAAAQTATATTSVTDGTGLASIQPTRATTVAEDNAAANNVAAAALTLTGDTALSGLLNTRLGGTDPIDANALVQGLNQSTWTAPALDMATTSEIAQKDFKDLVGGDRNKNSSSTAIVTTSTMHPIQALAAKSISWLSVVFAIMALLAGAKVILAFQRDNDWATFLTRGGHWCLLAGVLSFMSFLAW